MRPTKLLTILPAILLTLAGCSGDTGSEATADIESWDQPLPIASPWLREQLPAGVLAYQRIPHPLGLLALPKGNLLDTALGSEANIRNLIAIQEGLANNLTTVSPVLGDVRARILLEHLRSPVEIAGMAVPAPSALVAMTLDLRTNEDFEALFGELAAVPPFVGLIDGIDDAGIGQIRFDLPVFVRFEATTGRVAIYGGPMATRAQFESLLQASDRDEDPAMFALERQVDDSGQGFFSWVDARQALTMGGPFLPSDLAAVLRATSADQIRSIALGAGVADGKGRLKLVLDVGAGNPTRPFPVIRNTLGASSVGEPRGLFLFSLPSADEFARLEGLVFANLPPEARTQWNELKGNFSELSGATVEELLSAVGPEMLTIADDAGEYFALAVRDQALLDDVLGRLADRAGIGIGEHTVAGTTIHDVALPGAFSLPDGALGGEAGAMLGLAGRMQNRMYWLEDDGYVYLAGLPQLLVDRQRIGADTSLSDWLGETQRIDLSSALVAGSGSLRNLPRRLYQAYLGMMQGLADLAGVEYDIWSMPTPAELGLPDRGSIGVALNLGEPYVSLEFAYESHPAEVVLGGGGMAAVAVTGILAAIAIPAYQDYTIRAQVSEGLNIAASPRAAITAIWLDSNELPADAAAAGLSPRPGDWQGRYVEGVGVSQGAVIIRYGNAAHALIAGDTLVLTPYGAPGGAPVWVCGYAAPPIGLAPLGQPADVPTTIEPKYLPSACR